MTFWRNSTLWRPPPATPNATDEVGAFGHESDTTKPLSGEQTLSEPRKEEKDLNRFYRARRSKHKSPTSRIDNSTSHRFILGASSSVGSKAIGRAHKALIIASPLVFLFGTSAIIVLSVVLPHPRSIPSLPSRDLIIPVDGVGANALVDTWGAARSQGRKHEGTTSWPEQALR